jgi:hypothetical protein
MRFYHGGIMNKQSWVSKVSGVVMGAASVFAISCATAASSDPVEQFYNFQAPGQFQSFDPITGKSTYLISAVGRAPRVKENVIVRPRTNGDDDDDGYRVILTDAAITFDAFDPTNPAPIVNFTCAGCKLTYPDGSTLTSDPYVPLEGRALFLYGPVAPDPTSPIITIRMAGCSGLKEIAGVGKLANKVGSICFNGVFDFDVSDPTQLPATITGSSNCTIVTHTPVAP